MKHPNRQRQAQPAAENAAQQSIHPKQNSRTYPAAENTAQTAAYYNVPHNCRAGNRPDTSKKTPGRTGPEKTEAPAHLHDQMKTGTRGIYMLVSLMHKLTGTAYPDGDVLLIKEAGTAAERNSSVDRNCTAERCSTAEADIFTAGCTAARPGVHGLISYGLKSAGLSIHGGTSHEHL